MRVHEVQMRHREANDASLTRRMLQFLYKARWLLSTALSLSVKQHYDTTSTDPSSGPPNEAL